MPSPPDDIVSLGTDVLGTTQDGQGTVLAQMGNVIDATDTPSPNTEVWGPAGFISRPAPATPGTPGGACQAITINSGSNDVAIAFRDQRANIAINAGEACVFAPGPDGKGTTQVLIQNGTVTVTAGTVILGAAGDKASLDSKVQTELSAVWSEFGKVATALAAATCPPTGGPLVCTYTSASKSSPGATASSKVQLS